MLTSIVRTLLILFCNKITPTFINNIMMFSFYTKMVCLVLLFRFLTAIWIFANLKKCYILRHKDYQMLNRFLTPD